MKIFFVTAYDEQTNANLRIARNIIDDNDKILFGNQAIRSELHKWVVHEQYNEIMIMSHGNDNLVMDNDKQHAIVDSDCEIFSEAKIYIWACNTGKKLASDLSNYNSICWGYNQPVTAPSNIDEYNDFFIPLFREIKDIFVNGTNEVLIGEIINQIKIKCEEVEGKIDEADIDNDDIISLYACCRNIWANLIVCFESKKIKHPEAPDILYLIN